MKDPKDDAAAPGRTPSPLPPICNLEDLQANPPPTPPELISGILHQGCKMILGGTSKSNKSWCLLDLALSVASGQPWWGRPCAKARVLYLNFELHQWALASRIRAILEARPDLCDLNDSLRLWNLRGYATDASTLRPRLQEHLDHENFGLLVIDPAYKLLGNRDENANGDIAGLMNEFETLASRYHASVVFAHHFAKGNAAAKDPIDRMSGAGAWARDPDSIMVITPHEEESCYAVSSILRNHPQRPDFVLRWDYPLMRPVVDADPTSLLRAPQSVRKLYSDREFINKLLSDIPKNRAAIVSQAARLGLATRTTDRYLRRLARAGVICSGSGCYWMKTH